MRTLPILRTRYANSFAKCLEDSGIPTSRVLVKSGLDRKALEAVGNWMPLKQLEIFLEHALRTEGCFDIGLKASLRPRQGHSEFSRKVLYTSTLNQTLKGVCNYSSMEDTSAFDVGPSKPLPSRLPTPDLYSLSGVRCWCWALALLKDKRNKILNAAILIRNLFFMNNCHDCQIFYFVFISFH